MTREFVTVLVRERRNNEDAEERNAGCKKREHEWADATDRRNQRTEIGVAREPISPLTRLPLSCAGPDRPRHRQEREKRRSIIYLRAKRRLENSLGINVPRRRRSRIVDEKDDDDCRCRYQDAKLRETYKIDKTCSRSDKNSRSTWNEG